MSAAPPLDLDLPAWALPDLPESPFLAALDTLGGEKYPGQREAERSFAAFVRQAWPIVEPVTPLAEGYAFDAVCAHLQAVADGEIRNLLVTIPPGMLKSTLVSVMYPAHRWIEHPEHRFLTSSHDGGLALRDAVRSRRIITSDWYRERWGGRFRLTSDQNVKGRYENNRTGYRVAAGITAGFTGERGDTITCDDPHSVSQAESKVIREDVLRWWDEEMTSRINDPATGARIVIQQRVHEKDLAGHLIEQGGYVHLNLPMEYEPKAVHYTGFGPPDPRTEAGELLAPERIGPDEIAEFRLRLGPEAYAGQYQQRPVPAGGHVIKREWFRFWRHPLPEMERIIQYWDTAFKDGEKNDYTAAFTIGVAADGYYVLDRWHDKVLYPGLKRGVITWFERWLPDEVVVEDAASGQSLLQDLDAETRIPALAATAPRDKHIRIVSTTGIFEAGKVRLPADAEWRESVIGEAVNYPLGEHDDQIDALASGVRHLAFGDRAMTPARSEVLAQFRGLRG